MQIIANTNNNFMRLFYPRALIIPLFVNVKHAWLIADFKLTEWKNPFTQNKTLMR
jgi:hypothetical protein